VTFVADDDAGTTVGWIAMSPAGYIDMLFCLPEATRCGVASALYSKVEQSAIELGLTELTAHASLFAQSFFAKHGWVTDKTEVIVRNEVEIQRAVMSKRLPRLSAAPGHHEEASLDFARDDNREIVEEEELPSP
jgi:putative acetyltransferase